MALSRQYSDFAEHPHEATGVKSEGANVWASLLVDGQDFGVRRPDAAFLWLRIEHARKYRVYVALDLVRRFSIDGEVIKRRRAAALLCECQGSGRAFCFSVAL